MCIYVKLYLSVHRVLFTCSTVSFQIFIVLCKYLCVVLYVYPFFPGVIFIILSLNSSISKAVFPSVFQPHIHIPVPWPLRTNYYTCRTKHEAKTFHTTAKNETKQKLEERRWFPKPLVYEYWRNFMLPSNLERNELKKHKKDSKKTPQCLIKREMLNWKIEQYENGRE